MLAIHRDTVESRHDKSEDNTHRNSTHFADFPENRQMISHPISLHSMIRGAVVNRGLILQLAKRDLLGRYRGSFLGLTWSFLQPLFMLMIYTFVFSVIFKARWVDGAQLPTSGFVLVLFAGLTTFTLFAECVNRSPALIVSHPNYVKKVIFPLEVLPWVTAGSAAFHALASLAVLVLASLYVHGSVPWTIILVPLIWLPLVMLAIGVSWFLAATGVYFRDIGQITTFCTQALLFLSPVFYPSQAVPEPYQALLLANPISFIVDQVRMVAIWGEGPNWMGLLLYWMVTIVIAWLGYAWFQKVRRGFADVL
jgi:lipopolysaccharide transport system permease protein